MAQKSKARNDDRRHFARRSSDQDKARNHLGEVVREQADELKLKNGQLRNGKEEQKKSTEQIHVLTKAMESTSDGIFIINAQKPGFPVIYANQAFQQMTGYTKREILGQDYFSFYGAGADPRIVNEIKQTMSKGRSFHGEMLDFQKNGRKYWASVRIAPVRDPGGAVTHYVGIKTDVSLLREKESEIDEQREELLHVTRVGKLAEFVSSLAHEISQPLTAILSYAQAGHRMLLQREPKLREILKYIIKDDQRASEVIQRLRSLLKRTVPEMKPLDINVLIDETVKLIAADAIARNVVLKMELASDLPVVRGDRIQLQQVLLNLISNSFDAFEISQGAAAIAIRTLRKDAGTVLIEVEDSGSGISAQYMPKLFTRFFTSKPDGLGMGLSISRSIIEAHGGKLDGKNNSGPGATFYFTIPVDTKSDQ